MNLDFACRDGKNEERALRTVDYRDFEPLSALIFSTVLSPDRKTAYGVYSTLTKVDVEGSNDCSWAKTLLHSVLKQAVKMAE